MDLFFLKFIVFTQICTLSLCYDTMLNVVHPYDVFLTPALYYSCQEAYDHGFVYKGIYAISVNAPESIPYRWSWVVCNNTVDRASTVILYRVHGEENFHRNWIEYVNGFGTAKSDYWFGLENIRNLTEQGSNVLTVTFEDYFGAKKSIRYNDFRLGPAPNYRLLLGSPGEGDVPDDFWFHRNLAFRAPKKVDKRTSGMSCAEKLKIGWWFMDKDHCAYVLLTGRFNTAQNTSFCRSRKPFPMCDGIYWQDWSGFKPLKTVIVELSQH